jgi:hypothetical protein
LKTLIVSRETSSKIVHREDLERYSKFEVSKFSKEPQEGIQDSNIPIVVKIRRVSDQDPLKGKDVYSLDVEHVISTQRESGLLTTIKFGRLVGVLTTRCPLDFTYLVKLMCEVPRGRNSQSFKI